MPRRALLLAGVAALAVATLPAAAQDLDALGTKSGRVGPGAFLEQNLQLGAGDRIAWEVRWQPSTERASYDIHSHPTATEVRVFDNGTVAGGASGTFTVPTAGVYSWLVENDASRGALDVTISTRTAAEGRGTPAAPLPIVAAALLGAAAMAGRRRGA